MPDEREREHDQDDADPRWQIPHQASLKMAPPEKASSSILPQEGRSGSPRPRKESVVSDRIATGTVSVVLARISGEALGRMWRSIRWRLDAPRARLRST